MQLQRQTEAESADILTDVLVDQDSHLFGVANRARRCRVTRAVTR